MISKAILFDLDGTLVDTAPDLAAATDYALQRAGRPPVGLSAIRQMVGDGARVMVERGFETTGGQPATEIFEAAMADFFACYEANLADQSRPFPGVTTCLAELAERGYALAVCTNKLEHFSRSLLDQLGLSGFFAAVVGGDTLAVRKPDPGHLRGTIEKIGQPVGWAAMVGDSANDIDAARAAGLPSIAVSFGYTRTPAHALGADRLIDHFEELPAALAALGG